VIVESEDIHRRAYNAAFAEFDVRCPEGQGAVVDWSVEFYDMLQNKVGGGKPKMRWYFGEGQQGKGGVGGAACRLAGTLGAGAALRRGHGRPRAERGRAAATARR
jgi:hypothetical protein